MKKNILLTGASGSVGKETLKELVARKNDFNITVFDIENSKSRKIFNKYQNEIKIVYGDISNSEIFEEFTKNIDFVIHLAAIIPPFADLKPELAEKVNVRGTQNLIKAIEKNSPNAFFLYSSSISIYGDRIRNPWIKVGDKLEPSLGDEYAKTKIEAEKLLQNSKLNWSIFRFAAIMSPVDAKINPLLFHMPLNTSLEIATTRDTAFALVNSIEKTDLLNKQIFNLSGGKKCRIQFNTFVEKSFNLIGFGIPNFPKFAFAEKNFHCGYYEDANKLNEILNFQRDNIDTYFRLFDNSISKFQKTMIKIFRKFIFKSLINKSEPLKAFREKNEMLIERFFIPVK